MKVLDIPVVGVCAALAPTPKFTFSKLIPPNLIGISRTCGCSHKNVLIKVAKESLFALFTMPGPKHETASIERRLLRPIGAISVGTQSAGLGWMGSLCLHFKISTRKTGIPGHG